MVKKQKIIWKCPKHGLEFVSEGLCWKIIKPDLADKQTEKKYCNAKAFPDLIRRYERLGYMIPDKYSSMIPKNCIICNKEALLSTTESKCQYCRYVY